MSDTNEIDRLKAELVTKTAAMNGFLATIQSKDSEIRQLIDQRMRQDRRIENLEKLTRNQKRTEAYLMRSSRTAHQLFDIAQQLMMELTHENDYASLSRVIKDRIERFIMPSAPIHLVDFVKQLQDKASSDEEFKKLLKEMGFEEYEPITIDLGSPFDYENPNT